MSNAVNQPKIVKDEAVLMRKLGLSHLAIASRFSCTPVASRKSVPNVECDDPLFQDFWSKAKSLIVHNPDGGYSVLDPKIQAPE